MRCLVTGAEGFIGANLCAELQRRGHEVTGTSLNRRHQTSLDALGVRCRVEYGDVRDQAFLDRVVCSSEPEWVFHLAACAIVRHAAASPRECLETNILGTLNVADVCRGRARLVTASSDKAYGPLEGAIAYREDLPLRPVGAYELSKACADMIARSQGATVIRSANVFGPGDLNWTRLIPNSCRLAVNGRAPEVYQDAWDYQREWIDVESICDAYIHLAEHGAEGEAYNVGSGCTATAGAIAEMITRECEAPYPERVPSPGCYEIPAQVLDLTKIRQTGWEPRVHAFGTALSCTVEWYRRYLKPTGLKRLTRPVWQVPTGEIGERLESAVREQAQRRTLSGEVPPGRPLCDC